MKESPSVFPFAWKIALDNINMSEEGDILHDNEPPRPLRSKIIYLVFLVIYLFTEYPAQRIAVAYESVRTDDIKDPNQIFRTLGRLVFAVLLMPIFVPVWIILVIWTLLPSAMRSILNESGLIWKGLRGKAAERLDKDYPDQPGRGDENLDTDHGKEREIDLETTRGPPGAQANGNGEDHSPPSHKRLQEQHVQDCRDREARIRSQVSLLVNPPEMLDQFRSRRFGVRQRSKLSSSINV